MNDIRKHGIFEDPGEIAPHLEKAWRDDFIVELRLLDVPGERIGDALVTADTHVQESGERAEEAFGDATSYARETAQSLGHPSPGPRLTPRDMIGNVLGLGGMLGVTSAFSAWLEGTGVTVTLGTLLGLVVLLALVAGLFRWSTAVLRLAVQNRLGVALLTPIVLIGGFVAIYLVFSEPLFVVGAVTLGIVSIALLMVSSVLAVADSGRHADEIVAPGQTATTGLAARVGPALILPGFTLVLLALTLLTSRLA